MNKNKRIPKCPQDVFTSKQEAALLALLEFPTIEDAARSAGVSRTSLWAWMKKGSFRDKLTSARAEIFNEGLGALKGSMGKAAIVLGRLMDSKNENQRRLAAVSILEMGLRIHEGEELEARLRRLEEISAARGGPEGGISILALRKSLADYEATK